MTTQARIVLNDLRKVHSMLEIEEDLTNFRILWVSAITLARAVGHMLDKVDSKNSSLLKEVITNKWNDLKSNKDDVGNKIFFSFIENERNNLLKEYKVGILQVNSVFVVRENKYNLNIWNNDSCLFVPMVNNCYQSEDCRDFLLEAIEWWDNYLTEIEKKITQ